MRANGMIKRALFLLAVLTTMALPALAAEGAGEAQPSLLAGDIGNVVWTVLIFVLVLAVLGKYAWGPILSTLQARESFIHEALAKAKHDRDEAEARLKQYEERLAGARAEATAIVEEGRRDAEVVKRKIEAAAKVEADKASDLLVDSLLVINRKGRLGSLRAIAAGYRAALRDLRGWMDVHVRTAVPLTDPLRARLTEALAASTSRKPALIEQVDPAVIGGLIIQIEGRKIDASLASRLHPLSEALHARASRAIPT